MRGLRARLPLFDAQTPLTQLGHDLGKIGGADYRCRQSLQNVLASLLLIQEAEKGRSVQDRGLAHALPRDGGQRRCSAPPDAVVAKLTLQGGSPTMNCGSNDVTAPLFGSSQTHFGTSMLSGAVTLSKMFRIMFAMIHPLRDASRLQ